MRARTRFERMIWTHHARADAVQWRAPALARGRRSRETARGLDSRRLDRGVVVDGGRSRAVRDADAHAVPRYARSRAVGALRARRGLHLSEEGGGRAALAG